MVHRPDHRFWTRGFEGPPGWSFKTSPPHFWVGFENSYFYATQPLQNMAVCYCDNMFFDVSFMVHMKIHVQFDCCFCIGEICYF